MAHRADGLSRPVTPAHYSGLARLDGADGVSSRADKRLSKLAQNIPCYSASPRLH
jgi:hypothetical protein